MTDIEVFKKFMEWMNMEVFKEHSLKNGNTVVIYRDPQMDSELFTKQGYNEFDAGIIFDKNGNMIKAFIDSHVAWSSTNATLIYEINELQN